MLSLFFKLLVPYVTVGCFWCIGHNAWLALLSYHALILILAKGSQVKLAGKLPPKLWLFILPSLLSGPVLYFFLPMIGVTSLNEWLATYAVSGSTVALVCYFGLVHPAIEQIHWAPLCEKTPLAHFFFAGYHLLVLSTLLSPLWLLATFVLLTSVSYGWHLLRQEAGSLKPAILSHMFADFGVALLLLSGLH